MYCCVGRCCCMLRRGGAKEGRKVLLVIVRIEHRDIGEDSRSLYTLTISGTGHTPLSVYYLAACMSYLQDPESR